MPKQMLHKSMGKNISLNCGLTWHSISHRSRNAISEILKGLLLDSKAKKKGMSIDVDWKLFENCLSSSTTEFWVIFATFSISYLCSFDDLVPDLLGLSQYVLHDI